MISQRLQDAFNRQLVHEMFSSNLYLSMAASFESAGLSGMARWMHAQAGEERAHAMKFFHYLVDRGGQVKIGAVEAPPFEWPLPLAAFETALKHEQKTTAAVNDLHTLAAAEKDHAAGAFLQWFLIHQVEEEASATRNVEQLKLAGDNNAALLVIDHQLGKRE
ncbi:MAG: ferritin [Phycisphaerae bacterium]|nr:ferritin [Phycisphaerae bacterium]